MSPAVENAYDPPSCDRSFDVAMTGDVSTVATNTVVNHHDWGGVVGISKQTVLRVNLIANHPVDRYKFPIGEEEVLGMVWVDGEHFS